MQCRAIYNKLGGLRERELTRREQAHVAVNDCAASVLAPLESTGRVLAAERDSQASQLGESSAQRASFLPVERRHRLVSRANLNLHKESAI